LKKLLIYSVSIGNMNMQKFNKERYFAYELDLANTLEEVICEDREVAPHRRIVVTSFDVPMQDLTSKADKCRKLNSPFPQVK